MIKVNRETLKQPISPEDEFTLKIVADRYLLKAPEREPKINDVAVVEFTSEKENGAGYTTYKEICLVDENGFDSKKGNIAVTAFTGVDRGKRLLVKPDQLELLAEPDLEALQERVSTALSGGSRVLKKELKQRTMDKIVFGGRILAGAGTEEELTYFNCYVVPMIPDSRGGIADHRKTVMEIMSRGGGVGTNGSTLRPQNAKVTKVRGKSSGSVSWLDDLSQLTDKVQQGGSRRGAQMIALADFHPDLLSFITAKVQKPLSCTITVDGEEQTLKFGKRGNETLSGANISILVSDKFMDAYNAGEDWQLVFPDVASYTKEEMALYDEVWHTVGDPYLLKEQYGLDYKVYATIPAKDIVRLWAVCATGSAEPGILFLERANKFSNTWYFNPLIVTNPCGEQFLAPWSVCNLGHINLARHLTYNDGTGGKHWREDGKDVGEFVIDWIDLGKSVRALTRALDNVIDKTPYYFEANKENQLNERRLGLGTMGIDEMLKLLGLDYGTAEGREVAEKVLRFVTLTAYDESANIAKEKGSFRAYDQEKYLQSGFMQFLAQESPELIEKIKTTGIRNATIITQAPTGTTGTAMQTSTGIEPFYSAMMYRSSRLGVTAQPAPVIKRAESAGLDTSEFKYAMDYSTKQHLDFQAVAQKWCDSSVSKTINTPKGTTVEDVESLLLYAYENGLKGFTIYVDGSREYQVLSTEDSDNDVVDTSLPSDTYKTRNALSKADVSLTFKEGILVRVELDIEKVSDKIYIEESLANLIKQALDAHTSTDCNECGAPLIFTEGCYKCEACGFSKCG